MILKNVLSIYIQCCTISYFLAFGGGSGGGGGAVESGRNIVTRFLLGS